MFIPEEPSAITSASRLSFNILHYPMFLNTIGGKYTAINKYLSITGSSKLENFAYIYNDKMGDLETYDIPVTLNTSSYCDQGKNNNQHNRWS